MNESEIRQDLEPIEPENEVEVITEDAQLDSYKMTIDDMRWLAKNIDEIAELRKKIFMGILKLTHNGDFMIFGSGEKQRAEIGTAGCERIADVGVSVTSIKQTKELRSDDKGSYYNYVTTGTASFRGRTIPVISIVSSRDKFYGKADGELKENWEISEGDVQKASWRGVLKEAVKTMLGLRRLDPEELQKYGVKLTGSGNYNFQSKQEKADSANVVTVTIENVTQKTGKDKNGKDWSMFKVIDSEGVTYSTFNKSFAETAKLLKGKLAEIQFTKNKYGPELQSIKEAVINQTPVDETESVGEF